MILTIGIFKNINLYTMKKINFSIFLLLFLGFSNFCFTQNGDGSAASKVDDPKMKWWQDAKFGMFIHWGIYSIPAKGEWYMYGSKVPIATYSQYAKEFNPTQFNAEDWVQLAKAAGQKYIVITTKHHDGFAMFNTKACTYNIMDASPFKRDIVKELADACRKYNMKLGFYYSQSQDWYHKGGESSNGIKWDEAQKGDVNKFIDELVIPQVKELLSNYGDVAVLWWDCGGLNKELAQKLQNLLSAYPNIITNNRIGGGLGGDFETPERHVPATGFPGRNWEACMTMNGNWGYTPSTNWISPKEILQQLSDIVNKGGNLLLNVGPDRYGVIPEGCQENLRIVGKWLKLNGEAIYETKASPFHYLKWGRATRKGQTIFLHVFDWPKNGKLEVPMSNKISKAYLLKDKTKNLSITTNNETSIIKLPSSAPDSLISIIAVQFEGEPKVLPVPTADRKVKVSTTDVKTSEINLTDGNPKSKWRAKEAVKSASIEVDLGNPTSVQCLALVEPWNTWDKKTQKYSLQYLNGNDWKEIVKGETNGVGIIQDFMPTVAQKFRLIVDNEDEAPAINEFLLYR